MCTCEAKLVCDEDEKDVATLDAGEYQDVGLSYASAVLWKSEKLLVIYRKCSAPTFRGLVSGGGAVSMGVVPHLRPQCRA